MLEMTTEYYLPILVADPNASAAHMLARQIRHSGLEADDVSTRTAAEKAARMKHYGSLVVVANLRLAADFDVVSALRNIHLDTWIVAIGSETYTHVEQVVFRRVVDSFVVAPFSVEDLIGRLLAFARRSRPQ